MERFPPQKPSDLSPEDQKFHAELTNIRENLFGDLFVLQQADGSFAGPFETAFAVPNVFRSFINIAIELGKIPDLPKDARETAILVVGRHYSSGYEIYAHERLAKLVGLTWRQIDLIKTGRKPSGEDALSENCSIGYDVAVELMTGSGLQGRLSDECWNRAVMAFGKKGALTLCHYIGFYAYTCVLLNGAGVGIPHGESIKTPEL